MILHVISLDKFIPPFIDFVENNLPNFQKHLFFIFGDQTRYPIRKRENIIFCNDFHWKGTAGSNLIHLMYQAKKIIIHGLLNN